MAVPLSEFRPPDGVITLALGFFDGFHRGHQAIVEEAARDGHPYVFTFRNHPATVIDSVSAPPLLTSFEERTRLLAQAGATVVYCDFDRPFSQIEPADFAEQFLRRRLKAGRVVVGRNYRFGYKARGTVDELDRLGSRLGFETTVVDPVVRDGDWISSTRIRGLVARGEVEEATAMLGRPYFLTSVVERGNERGREMGSPTANLTLPHNKITPARGVYAVRIRRESDNLAGVANLGVRPTFGEDRLLLEVHLLDYRGELYGERLEVSFIRHLREERRFPSKEALIEQIARDVEEARRVLL